MSDLDRPTAHLVDIALQKLRTGLQPAYLGRDGRCRGENRSEVRKPNLSERTVRRHFRNWPSENGCAVPKIDIDNNSWRYSCTGLHRSRRNFEASDVSGMRRLAIQAITLQPDATDSYVVAAQASNVLGEKIAFAREAVRIETHAAACSALRQEQHSGRSVRLSELSHGTGLPDHLAAARGICALLLRCVQMENR
ncbi:hypothetical protein [Paracoccus sp. S1E-3]|uniref:hypothetical protein n=1 Tax=Paracoccus sp. S1E-3 TaxID=2756130 RepID=UPI0015EE9753|nr:hypothetical protein [Paracoccus sp. S1E-3]MBA4492609.1 hypothetical protein [Paracoccus sp. S1E-3]